MKTLTGENPGYLCDGQAPLYFMSHRATGQPRGTVLLCSALALESTHTALVWRRVARALANAGWDCVRFDWSGTGESGGRFEDVTFEQWKNDVRRMARALAEAGVAPVSRRSAAPVEEAVSSEVLVAEASVALADAPDTVVRPSIPRTGTSAGDRIDRMAPGPLVLLGLRGGALMAAHVFAEGVGDSLITWEAPASGEAHLMDILRRKLACDMAAGEGPRKTRDDYIAELQADRPLEVDGFCWTRDFWESFRNVSLPPADSERPTCVINTRTHQLARPVFWQDAAPLHPDISGWLKATLAHLDTLSTTRTTMRRSPQRSVEARFGGVQHRLFVVPFEGQQLIVTQHVGHKQSSVAMLLVNFGYVPRSGQAGMGKRLSDAMALSGVDTFRLDLPCLGDSEGDLPTDTPNWLAGVRSGSMCKSTLFVMERLKEWFGYDRFVLGGLCAAATTALYVHEQHPETIAGLLLLEPEFFTTEGQETRAMPASPAAPEDADRPKALLGRARALARGAMSSWAWMRVLSGEHTIFSRVPIPRAWVRQMLWLRRGELPARTNVPLVAAWQTAVRARVPTLVVTAEGKIREVFFERVNLVAAPHYTEYLRHEQGSRHVRIPSTNHTFTTGGAIDKMISAVQDWVGMQFLSP